MDENEFDNLIAEGLLPEPELSFTINFLPCISSCHINVNIDTSIKDIIDELEERVKRLEEKDGQDEGST